MADDEREAMMRARELPWTDCAFLLARLDAERQDRRATSAGLAAMERRHNDALGRAALWGADNSELTDRVAALEALARGYRRAHDKELNRGCTLTTSACACPCCVDARRLLEKSP